MIVNDDPLEAEIQPLKQEIEPIELLLWYFFFVEVRMMMD